MGFTLKALITTAADDKFCNVFPNFQQNKERYFLRIVCQPTILMKYRALIVILKKRQNLKLSSAANYRWCHFRANHEFCRLLSLLLMFLAIIVNSMDLEGAVWSGFILFAVVKKASLICTTVKPVLSVNSKRPPKLIFKTDYRLMQVKNIAECSKGSILQYFGPSLSYHLSLLISLFCLFLSGRLRQVLL